MKKMLLIALLIGVMMALTAPAMAQSVSASGAVAVTKANTSATIVNGSGRVGSIAGATAIACHSSFDGGVISYDSIGAVSNGHDFAYSHTFAASFAEGEGKYLSGRACAFGLAAAGEVSFGIRIE